MQETKDQFIEKLKDDSFYYSDKSHVSCSMLKHLLKSPIHLQMYLDNPPPSTPAMAFGSALHCLLLEPEKFNDGFYIYDTKHRPEKDKTMASKANKEWKAKQIRTSYAKNQILITSEDLDKIDDMISSMTKHDDVNKILATCEKEKAIAWSNIVNDSTIDCKGKIDLATFDYIADVKTTAEFGGIDKFRYDCKKYHYDMQAAFYCDALGLDQFKFIVVGKNAPYDVGIFDISPEFLESGRQKYKYALSQYEKYFISCAKNIDNYIEKGTL